MKGVCKKHGVEKSMWWCANKNGVEAYRESCSKCRDEDDPKYWMQKRMSSAHRKVVKAVKDGVLKRGQCRNCDSEKTVAHHTDYSKPLQVVWLCKRCHGNEHARLTRLAAMRSKALLLMSSDIDPLGR